MIHMYAVVLAVVLLVGALVAIIICICVDIVPIIKSRGSTLVSRDSVTQEQSRLLKKSLQQRKQLTSSASADFVDCGQGRKSLAQALLATERPRFGSTPLCLLTGEEDKNSDVVEYKTTTVIIEALPKKTPENNNNNNDETMECDVTKDIMSPEGDNRQSSTNSSSATSQQREILKQENKVQSSVTYGNRRLETSYTEEEHNDKLRQANISRMQDTKAISGSSPNIARGRTNSIDGQEYPLEVKRSSMTYNARETQLKTEFETRSYPNSPNFRSSRTPLREQDKKETKNNNRNNQEEPRLSGNGPDVYDGPPARGCDPRRGDIYGRNENSPSGYSSGTPSSCASHGCKLCHLERERAHKEVPIERHLPFRRTESFPDRYTSHSSPQISHRQILRQHSLDDDSARGSSYERQSYGRAPAHAPYIPCPECCHSNHPLYYPYNYHCDHTYPEMVPGVPGVRNSPKPAACVPPGPFNPLMSSSSSSSSSGSSSRFRHLRQPLEDIQEDASDYVIGGDVTSTIDSRELDSCVDDDIRPKSQENSIMSVSPLSLSDKQPSFVAASGS